MGSSAKRRQTMAKMNRERALKERRELKQEKREARRLAAASDQGEREPGETALEDE
jgi:hypothetical protein